MIWIRLCQALNPGLRGSSHWTRSIHQSHPSKTEDKATFVGAAVLHCMEYQAILHLSLISSSVVCFHGSKYPFWVAVTGLLPLFLLTSPFSWAVFALLLVKISLCVGQTVICVFGIHVCLVFSPLVVSKSMLALLNTSQYIQVEILNFDLF